jgi:hypothetical protein
MSPRTHAFSDFLAGWNCLLITSGAHSITVDCGLAGPRGPVVRGSKIAAPGESLASPAAGQRRPPGRPQADHGCSAFRAPRIPVRPSAGAATERGRLGAGGAKHVMPPNPGGQAVIARRNPRHGRAACATAFHAIGKWCATHQSAPHRSWCSAFRASRIPIRTPAVAVTGRGRRAAGWAAGHRAREKREVHRRARTASQTRRTSRLVPILEDFGTGRRPSFRSRFSIPMGSPASRF